MSEQEVFDYIYSVITREYLENRIQKKENFGITAKDIADHFNTYRSTVSTMLNTAVKNGLFIKIETRPVLFVPVDIIKTVSYTHRVISQAITCAPLNTLIRTNIRPIGPQPFTQT